MKSARLSLTSPLAEVQDRAVIVPVASAKLTKATPLTQKPATTPVKQVKESNPIQAQPIVKEAPLNGLLADALKRKQAATPPNEMKASGIKSDIQPQATKTAALSGLAQDALKRNEAGYNYV